MEMGNWLGIQGLGGAKQMTGCSLEEKCGENFWKLRQNEIMLTWTTEGAVHVISCSTSQRDDHKMPKEEWIDWQETVHQRFKPGSVSVSSGMAQPYLGGLSAILKWMGSEPSPPHSYPTPLQSNQHVSHFASFKTGILYQSALEKNNYFIEHRHSKWLAVNKRI